MSTKETKNEKELKPMNSKELKAKFEKIQGLINDYYAVPVLRFIEQEDEPIFESGVEQPRHNMWKSDSENCILYFGRKTPIKNEEDCDLDEEIKKLTNNPELADIIEEQYFFDGSINLISSDCGGKTPEEALEKLEKLCELLKKDYILISEIKYKLGCF